MGKIKLSDAAYNVLKWLALIALPAIATFWGVVSKVWGIPYGPEIVTTITAAATLIGTLIGISHININKEKGEEADEMQSTGGN